MRHSLYFNTLPEDGGPSRRQQMEKEGLEVHEPEVFEAGHHLVSYFWELDDSRQIGMGMNPFSFQEIQAWSSLRCIDISPWEVSVLKAMDNARRQGPQEPEEQIVDNMQVITPMMFDALFG